jgi:hypothetical protein
VITFSHIRNLFQDQSFSKADCVGFSGVAIIWPNLSDSCFPEKAIPFRSYPFSTHHAQQAPARAAGSMWEIAMSLPEKAT